MRSLSFLPTLSRVTLSLMKLGTLDWLEHTGGSVRWTDRLALVAQGVRAKAAARADASRGTKARDLEVKELLPPDSAIVRAAMAMSKEASEPYLFNHCLRAYFWARLLHDGRTDFDDEALFVALLLHDLGLTDAHRLRPGAGECFTLVGAQAAARLGAEHGWDGPRARLTAEAIALHLNVIVGDEHGPEARMVRAGSGADVAGLGLARLDATQIDEVVARHPRFDLKSRIVQTLRLETEAHPSCRIAFLGRKLGFFQLISKTPHFSE